jgi:hypothetical protein
LNKILVGFGVGCLIIGSTFVLNNAFEKAEYKQLSKEEAQKENELLPILKVLIQEKLKGNDEVREIKSDNKESIIIETSIESSDLKNHMDLTEEIFSELKIMNKQNGINGIVFYTVHLKTKDGIVVSELKFGDYPPSQ